MHHDVSRFMTRDPEITPKIDMPGYLMILMRSSPVLWSGGMNPENGVKHISLGEEHELLYL